MQARAGQSLPRCSLKPVRCLYLHISLPTVCQSTCPPCPAGAAVRARNPGISGCSVFRGRQPRPPVGIRHSERRAGCDAAGGRRGSWEQRQCRRRAAVHGPAADSSWGCATRHGGCGAGEGGGAAAGMAGPLPAASCRVPRLWLPMAPHSLACQPCAPHRCLRPPALWP